MNDLLSASTVPEELKPRVFPPLTLADRSCAMSSGSTQALVRVVKGKQDLLLDGHSYTMYEATLLASGWSVYEDIRETH